jgi:hypothetical protein
MEINIVAQLNRYKELSAIVCNYADKIQKQTALSNILNGITSLIPDIISDNLRKIGDFGNFYFRNYVACPLFSAMCDDIGSLIHFVDEHIDEILLFENDSEKTQQERKRKSDQL